MATARITSSVAYVVAQLGTPVRVTSSVIYVVGQNRDEGGGRNPQGEPTCPESILFGGMKNQTLVMLGEDPAAPVLWTKAEIGRFINDAYSDAAVASNALECIEVVALTEGEANATLTDNVAKIRRVTWNDQKLPNVSKTELDRDQFDWEHLTGVVTNYVTSSNNSNEISTFRVWDGSVYNARNVFPDDSYDYSEWVLGSSFAVGDRVTRDDPDAAGNTIGYVCILAHSSASEEAGADSEPGVGADWETYWAPLSLVVWATHNPVAMTDDSDECLLPPWTHIAVCYDAASRALSKHGEQKNKATAMVYADMAKRYWDKLKAIVAAKSGTRTLSQGANGGLRKPQPWDTPVVE